MGDRRWAERMIIATIGLFLIGYICIYVSWVQEEHYQSINSNRHLNSANQIDSLSEHRHDDPIPNQGLAHVSEQIQERHFLFDDIPKIKQNGDYLHDLIVLTTATSSFIDFTENWLLSINNLGGVHPRIYIIAEDQETFDYFRTSTFMSNVNVIRAPNYVANSSLLFDTDEYKNFVNKRPKYILDILDTGHDVLFCDVDIVWFHRPYKFLQDSKVDMLFLQDQGPPDETVLCAGFVYYRANNATKQFIKRWIAEINSFKDPRPDQVVLNRLLIKNKLHIKMPPPKVKYEVLDPDKFVSGRFYFDKSWRQKHKHVKPVVLHNNWIVGRDVKVKRFKEIGKWFLK